MPQIAGVRILGTVRAVAADGSFVDLPSASQRRLLAILALHAPHRLRSDRLADVLGVTVGALRKSVSPAAGDDRPGHRAIEHWVRDDRRRRRGTVLSRRLVGRRG